MRTLTWMFFFAIAFYISNSEGALPEYCAAVLCIYPGDNCRQGTFRPQNQCCNKCRGEYFCPEALECDTITCKKDEDCGNGGEKCCDCGNGGTVCSKVTGSANSNNN